MINNTLYNYIIILVVFLLLVPPANQVMAQSGRNRAEFFKSSAIVMHKKGHEDTAFVLLKIALKLFSSNQDSINIADCHSLIGLILQNKGEYEEALLHYKLAGNIFNHKPGSALSEQNLTLVTRTGTLYFDQGNYKSAEIEFNKALKLARFINNKSGLILCHVNLGAIAEVYEDFNQAEVNYKHSLKESYDIKDYLNSAISLYNLGSICFKQSKIREAYNYFTLSLHLSDSIGDHEGVASCLSYLGMVFELAGKKEAAMQNYTQALKVYEELGQQKNVAGILTLIGKNLLESNNVIQAKGYFSRSLYIAQKIGAKPEIADNYEYLAMISAYEGDFITAGLFFDEFSEIVTSNKENIKGSIIAEENSSLNNNKNHGFKINKTARIQILLFALMSFLSIISGIYLIKRRK